MYEDLDRIRKQLEDYYGTAMFNGNPAAQINLSDVEGASDDVIADLAQQYGIDVPEDDD